MKLWGVVVEVNQKDLVVGLPGGLRGFVRAEDASDCFSGTRFKVFFYRLFLSSLYLFSWWYLLFFTAVLFHLLDSDIWADIVFHLPSIQNASCYLAFSMLGSLCLALFSKWLTRKGKIKEGKGFGFRCDCLCFIKALH